MKRNSKSACILRRKNGTVRHAFLRDALLDLLWHLVAYEVRIERDVQSFRHYSSPLCGIRNMSSGTEMILEPLAVLRRCSRTPSNMQTAAITIESPCER